MGFILGILAVISVYSQNQVSITADNHYNKLANMDLSHGYPMEEEKE
ncbi:hypothetical protein [Sebaldella sp. S0638]|nr:hypothetical protein [Sebaldella sp. S0638]MCP1226587.1 hypothetical protein [Sebaldella sp. S0638]